MTSYYEELCAKADPALADAELSVRSLRCLLNWRPAITLKELCDITDEVLMKVPGMGRKSVREIREACENYMFPSLFREAQPFETNMEQYARRQAEALEGIRMSLMNLVEIHKIVMDNGFVIDLGPRWP